MSQDWKIVFNNYRVINEFLSNLMLRDCCVDRNIILFFEYYAQNSNEFIKNVNVLQNDPNHRNELTVKVNNGKENKNFYPEFFTSENVGLFVNKYIYSDTYKGWDELVAKLTIVANTNQSLNVLLSIVSLEMVRDNMYPTFTQFFLDILIKFNQRYLTELQSFNETLVKFQKQNNLEKISIQEVICIQKKLAKQTQIQKIFKYSYKEDMVVLKLMKKFTSKK